MPGLTIADVLIPRDLVHMRANISVAEAARVMALQKIGAVLITEHDHLEGIFTERDLVHRVVAAGRDVDRTKLDEVMTPDPVSVTPATSVEEALRTMRERRLRHLPVISDGRVIGVVSSRDIMSERVKAPDELMPDRNETSAPMVH